MSYSNVQQIPTARTVMKMEASLKMVRCRTTKLLMRAKFITTLRRAAVAYRLQFRFALLNNSFRAGQMRRTCLSLSRPAWGGPTTSVAAFLSFLQFRIWAQGYFLAA